MESRTAARPAGPTGDIAAEHHLLFGGGGVGEDPLDRTDPPVEIERRDQRGGLLADLGQDRDGAGDYRRAGGHRLERRYPVPLDERREDKGGGAAVERREVLVVDAVDDPDPVPQSEPVDSLVDVVAHARVTAADEHEGHGRVEPGQHVEQQHLVLVRPASPDVEQVEAGQVQRGSGLLDRCRRPGPRAGEADAVRDHHGPGNPRVVAREGLRRRPGRDDHRRCALQAGPAQPEEGQLAGATPRIRRVFLPDAVVHGGDHRAGRRQRGERVVRAVEHAGVETAEQTAQGRHAVQGGDRQVGLHQLGPLGYPGEVERRRRAALHEHLDAVVGGDSRELLHQADHRTADTSALGPGDDPPVDDYWSASTR